MKTIIASLYSFLFVFGDVCQFAVKLSNRIFDAFIALVDVFLKCVVIGLVALFLYVGFYWYAGSIETGTPAISCVPDQSQTSI